MLQFAHFPQCAHPGQVPVATPDRLTLISAGAYVVLGLAAAYLFTRFPFGRAEPDARLARMPASAEAEGAPRASPNRPTFRSALSRRRARFHGQRDVPTTRGPAVCINRK